MRRWVVSGMLLLGLLAYRPAQAAVSFDQGPTFSTPWGLQLQVVGHIIGLGTGAVTVELQTRALAIPSCGLGSPGSKHATNPKETHGATSITFPAEAVVSGALDFEMHT